MIELDKYEQQIILASKSWGEWAKREGRYKAVRVVVSQYYGISEDELPIYTMYHCLLELFLKVKQNNINSLQYFMVELFRDLTEGGEKEFINKEFVVKNLISCISNIPVRTRDGEDIFNELETDYEILNKGINETNIKNKGENK